MKYLKKKKIVAQQHYIPLYKFTVFKEKVSSLNGSERYFKNSISIPIFVNLSNKNQNKIIKIIKNYLKN